MPQISLEQSKSVHSAFSPLNCASSSLEKYSFNGTQLSLRSKMLPPGSFWIRSGPSCEATKAPSKSKNVRYGTNSCLTVMLGYFCMKRSSVFFQ